MWQLDARHDVNEFNVSASDVGTTVARLVADNHGNDTTLEDILKLLGIVDLASRGIRFTSSGQVRHAMIARALFQCPQLLILD